MTGHQPTPSMDVDIVGEHTYKQNIDRIVEAMLGQGVHVVRANPAYRETWKKMLEETILRDGVKVIVADKECGITLHRRESQRGTRGNQRTRFPARKALRQHQPRRLRGLPRMHEWQRVARA